MTEGRTGWVLGGRYRVIDRIGTGGMAEVFRAHDDNLDRDVAIKVFRSDVEAEGTAGADRRGLELQALARLSHPNLITLFDGSMASPSYLVMELVEGDDLAQRLDHGPLSPAQVRELGAQIASALAYVHSQGLAHRDVKPANILLGRDGRARLSDFGIVRLLGSPRVTSADLTVGTASYLAPEQARGSDVGSAADVYSLGLVLIEAFTGVRSFDGPAMEAMAARLTRPPDIPTTLPPPWPQLLSAMTSIDPAGRPSAAQVAQTLQGAGSPPPPTPADATTAYRGAVPPVAAAALGSTTAMPRTSAMPPVSRPRTPDATPPPPPVDRGPSPWRPALITLGLLFGLAIIGVVAYALVSNGSGGSDNGPAVSNSPSQTSGVSHSSHPTSASTGGSSNSSNSSPTHQHSKHSHSHGPTSSARSTPSSPSTSSRSAGSSSGTTSGSPSSKSKSKSKSKGNGNGNGNGNGKGNGNGGG